jgi:glycosyltransferase EpsD
MLLDDSQKAHKVLFTSHTANFAKFNYPFMEWFKARGWRVDYASAGEEEVRGCDNSYIVPFKRSPFSKSNIQAYRQLKKIIMENRYDIIHTHTPMGSVVTRLAARKARRQYGTKVIYTAHGFHFFKGAPKVNWMLYYPVEKLMAGCTDCIVTINDEDYGNAVDRGFKAGRIEKIDGVGVNLERFHEATADEKSKQRRKLGYGDDEFLMICVAELNDNKNQDFLISAMAKLPANCKLLLLGKGDNEQRYAELIGKFSLEGKVKLLGYRTDVDRMYEISDVLVTASHREGLAVNIMEGMACGLPVVCTDVRGQRDLVSDGVNGFLYQVDDEAAYLAAVRKLYEDVELRKSMGERNLVGAQRYSVEKAVDRMAVIYEDYM